MEQSNKKNKNAGVRGVSWREKEILDLLDIWGGAKVQAALRTSHRNLENFQKIANEMMARGHRRTAEECRTKTKTMRLEYRRVVAHNNQPGNTPTSCPYYAELHSILRGDGSVKPQRLMRGVKLQPLVPRQVNPVPVQPGLEELFSPDLSNIISVDIGESHPTFTAAGATIKEEDLDETQVDSYPGEAQGSGSAGEEESSNEGRTPTQESLHGSSDAPESAAPPSPATRLATVRSKKTRVSGTYSIAERMMEHSTWLLERELEERRRDREMELAEQRRCREEWRRGREDRARFMREFLDQRASVNNSLQMNFTMLQSAVDAIKAIISQPRTGGDGPSGAHSCTGHSAQPAPAQLTPGDAGCTATQGAGPTAREDEEDLDGMQIEDHDGGAQGEESAAEERSTTEGGSPTQEMPDGSSDAEGCPDPPPPASRLANAPARKKSSSGAHSVAERMMERSTQLTDREVEHRRQELEDEQRRHLEEQRRYLEEQRRREEEFRMFLEQQRRRDEMEMRDREERTRLVQDFLQRNFEVLQSVVDAIKAIATRPSRRATVRSGARSSMARREQLTSTPESSGLQASTETQGESQERYSRRVVRRKAPYSP